MLLEDGRVEVPVCRAPPLEAADEAGAAAEDEAAFDVAAAVEVDAITALELEVAALATVVAEEAETGGEKPAPPAVEDFLDDTGDESVVLAVVAEGVMVT